MINSMRTSEGFLLDGLTLDANHLNQAAATLQAVRTELEGAVKMPQDTG
jgi:hypothetical protein